MKKCKIAIGFEGSANKIGIGIVTSDGTILANPRHTYITPPGHGFLPRETAHHHLHHVLPLLKSALQTSTNPRRDQRFRHGSAVAILSHCLSQLWKKPIVIADSEGRYRIFGEAIAY
ncbi:hypothetical protein YC2023_043103 [Brassica napus]